MTATHLASLFPEEDLQSAIDDGFVSTQVHPMLPLVIYNYTPAAQYGRAWNNVTTQCRGLIADLNGYIVARPFGKFFNYGETDQYDGLPEGNPVVSEKMDGSLGIIYTYKTATAVATRGSFASDQAQWATKHLHENYPDFAQPEGVTTLVEIIYPRNRIVVDYGPSEGLWLLGAIYNPTGQDIDQNKIDWWTGPTTPTFPWGTDKAIRAATGDGFYNGEGVVLCWHRDQAPSFRLKVKHPRYVELHRIVTGLSTRSVYEALAAGTLDDLIANTPDEFHRWIRQVSEALTSQFSEIKVQAVADWFNAQEMAGPFYDRRELAVEIKKTKYPGLCFALEDEKDIAARIWAMIRPERVAAMILDNDNQGEQ